MADSTLRMHIVTALDNAGIKATKEQIAGLEKELSKLNNSAGGIGNIEKQLGKLKGPLGGLEKIFGGIGGAIGKVGGIAASVIGAFKLGWDLGSFIYDKVITPLFNIKDPIEELKKSNKALLKEHEKLVQSYERQKAAADDAYSNGISKIDREAQQVDKLAAAWIKTTRAKNAYNNLGMDAAEQALERNRFEDVLRYQLEGDTAGAEQINAVYDIQKSMLAAKKEMVKYDQETEILYKKQEAREEARFKLLEKIAAEEKNVEKKKQELQYAEDYGDNAKTVEEHERAIEKANKRLEQARIKLQNVKQDLEVFDEDTSLDEEIKARQAGRDLLGQRLSLTIDKEVGKLAVANEKNKRDLAEKNKESQQISDDYYKRIGQMDEDSALGYYKHNKNLSRIEDQYAKDMRNLNKWYGANPDSEDEYNERLDDINQKRLEAIANENESYANSVRNSGRQYDSLAETTGRQLEKLGESINKIPMMNPDFMRQIYDSVDRFKQNDYEADHEALAEMLEKLLEMKQ